MPTKISAYNGPGAFSNLSATGDISTIIAQLDRRYGRVIASNTNAVASPTSSGQIYTFTMPAGLFVNNGDHVHFNSGVVAVNATILTLTYKIGALQVWQEAIDNSNDDFDGNSFNIGFEVIRTSSSNLLLHGFFEGTATPPSGGSSAHMAYWVAAPTNLVNFANPISLSIFANSDGLGDFNFIGAHTEFHPSP